MAKKKKQNDFNIDSPELFIEAIKSIDEKIKVNVYNPIEFISTGSMIIDEICGGGIPRGKITELTGDNSSGKTSVSVTTATQCQKAGGKVLWLDAENSFHKDYFVKLGLDLSPEKFTKIAGPLTGEKYFNIAAQAIKSGYYDLVVLDSITALIPGAAIGDIEETSQMGLHARMVSKGINSLNNALAENDKTAVILINQQRLKLSTYISSNAPTGGNAMKFFPAIKLKFRAKELIAKDSEFIALKMEIKTLKNKVSSPKVEGEAILYFDRGFDRISELAALAIAKGIVLQSGAWITYGEDRIQGYVKFVEYIKQNKLEDELEEKIKTTKF